MKSLDPLSLCRLRSSAPALNRGLAVLAALDPHTALSLDDLADRLPLPKASLFRLLVTLQQAGLVHKNSKKYYSALWGMHPLKNPRILFRQQLEDRLEQLSDSTSSTIEWYEPDPAGMKLILQNLPETEIRVQARPGMLREWTGEFEAVTRLGFAFAETPPPPDHADIFTGNGKSERIGPRKITSLLASARSQRMAIDPAFNTNSVRRHALAVFDDSVFLGVLALAEVHRFEATPPRDFLPVMQKFLKGFHANSLH